MTPLSPKLEALEAVWRKRAKKYFARSKRLAKEGKTYEATRDQMAFLATTECADELHRLLDREFPKVALSHPWRKQLIPKQQAQSEENLP